MATVWTVPEDITRVLLAASGIRDFLTDDEGRGVVSDPKVRLAEFTAVVDSLQRNAGRTFTSVRDAAGVLFDAPATGGVVVSDALRLAVMRVITAEPRERKPAPNPLAPRVVEHLGLYVYALQDPRDRSIFYVGAGRGNKVYSHDWDALGEAGTLDAEGVGDPDRDETRSAWIQRIRDIYAAGHSVEHIVLRHRIDATHEVSAAKEVAHVVVDALRLLEHHPDQPVLTNLAGEPADLENRAMPVEELAVQYSAEPAPDLPVPGALVRVPAAAGAGLTADELYAVCRGPWRAGAAARNVTDLPVIVFADNIIRAVYRVSTWDGVGPAGEQEWRFTGAVDKDLEAKYVGTRVTPDRAGLKAWPAHGWVQRLTMARPHGR